MSRRTKPGEPPDMRTLDDPEPRAITHEMVKNLPQIEVGTINSAQILPSQERRADALRVDDWVVRPACPNAWRRFWTWALLGWRWERIE